MNLVPDAERLPVPALDDLLAAYPGGLTTAEVARVLADTTTEPDPAAAEDALIRLSVAGGAKRRSSATTRSGRCLSTAHLVSPLRAAEPPMG